MQSNIPAVCDAIREPSGEGLLRLLRAVYISESDSLLRNTPAELIAKAIDLQVMTREGERLALTDAGYLAGNIAKEYCNWVDAGRKMPPPRPEDDWLAGKDVLDLGCSFGRWSWEFQRVARSVVGLELQSEYALFGAALAEREGITPPEIRTGSAERVNEYFPHGSFDFVFCRLVFNHVFVRSTLGRVAQVLRPGGVLWLQVESIRTPWRGFWRRHPGRNLRNKVFTAFGLLNSLVFTASGWQMRISARGRMHTEHKPVYPTVAAWRRALRWAGFTGFQQAPWHGDDLAFWARREN